MSTTKLLEGNRALIPDSPYPFQLYRFSPKMALNGTTWY